MTMTLDGTSGLTTPGVVNTAGETIATTLAVTGVSTFAAGTALLPALTTTGDTNTGVWFPAADTVAASTGGTERIRIDSSGKVGIGTASPTAKLSVTEGSSNLDVGLLTTVSTKIEQTTGDLRIRVSSVISDSFLETTRNIIFGTGASYTERMRIDSSGNLLFNSGYGSAATAYGCRAWVNFNGIGTVAIRGSGNVSSITDSGVGTYAINLTTAMPDVNGAIVSGKTNQTSNAANATGAGWDSTSAIGVVVYEAGVKVDASNLYFSAFR